MHDLQPTLAQSRSGRWEIRFSEKLPDGSWRSRTVSTRTADRGDAERFLAGWLGAYQAAQASGPLTIADLCGHYWADAQSRGVTAAQRQALDTVIDYFGGYVPGQLTPAVFADHRRLRRHRYTGKPLQPGSLRRELVALGTVLRYAAKVGLIPRDQVPYVPLPAAPAGRDVWLTEDQEAKLLQLAADTSAGQPRLTRIHRFVWLALCTGSRCTAILQLPWSQVDFGHGMIDFRNRKRTRKRRVPVPIQDRLRPLLEQAYRERTSPFVLDHAGNMRHPWYALTRGTEFDGLRIHDMRRTFATLLVRAGVDLWQVAGLLGDTMEVVQAHYAHHAPDYLRSAINRRATG